MSKYKYVQGIECPDCKQRIWSRARHDFRRCTCSNVFVDGGRDYLRYGCYNTTPPKVVRLRIYKDSPDAKYLNWSEE